jgi:predicted Zn-dependent protease
MKSIKTKIIIILLFALSGTAFGFDKPNEEIFKAMRDELHRSMDNLKIDGLQSPYFIEYQYMEYDTKSMRATLGSVEANSSNQSAYINVGVRVGDYKFDNTNFFDIGLGFFGSSDDEENFKKRKVSYSPDYNYLRKEFWLATDGAYKQSAELYSKKKAILKNRIRKDTIPDFMQLDVVPVSQDIKTIPKFDEKYFANVIEQVSAVFKGYPEIFSSSVNIEFLPKRIYYVNSEGIEYVKDSYYTGFEIVAASQSKDGMPVFDHYTTYSFAPNDMPSIDSLLSAAKILANNIKDKLSLSQLDDYYVGPIIFSNQAAAELFAQSFVPKLVSQREPLTDGGFSSDDEDAAFQRKVGGRVLPKFISVYDKPTLNKLNGVDLIGAYNIDDNGLKAQDVELIKDGYLETLLSGRVPTKRIKESNAHKRGGSVMFSNIIVKNTDTEKTKSSKELERSMLEMVKKRDLEYGIIIEKILDANIRYTSLYRVLNGNIELPFGKDIYVMEGFKLYKDGKREKFSGMVVPPMNVLQFKDILLTSNKSYTLNFLAPSVISPYLSGGDGYLQSSVTIPDLLFEDGELHLIDGDFKRPPYVQNSLNN